jgi:hypothetical protein
MVEAAADDVVTGFDDLAEGLILLDSGDRHVLAAAISRRARRVMVLASSSSVAVRTVSPSEPRRGKRIRVVARIVKSEIFRAFCCR